MSSREFCYGDEVTAIDIDGVERTGVVNHLTWGGDKEGNDVIREALLFDETANVFWAVRPDTLRYVVDRNGFWFRTDKERGTVTIGRNDDLLLDPVWVRFVGARLIHESLYFGEARASWRDRIVTFWRGLVRWWS